MSAESHHSSSDRSANPDDRGRSLMIPLGILLVGLIGVATWAGIAADTNTARSSSGYVPNARTSRGDLGRIDQAPAQPADGAANIRTDVSTPTDARTGLAVLVRTPGGRPVPHSPGCVYPLPFRDLKNLVSPTRFVTDAQGCAEVLVPPGAWAILLAIDPNGYRKARVSKDAITPVDYTVEPHVIIVGRVTDSRSRPIADASIEVTSVGAASVRLPLVHTGANGTFRTRVVGNECVLVASASGYADASLDVYVEGKSRGGLFECTIVLGNETELRGIVKNGRGEPVAGCVLIATSLAARTDDELSPTARGVVSDSEGSFHIQRLAVGPQSLRAQAEGYLDWSGTVETEADRVNECEVELEPARGVSGEVRDEDGVPVANALVACYAGKERVARTRSAQDGSFALERCPTADLWIWASHEQAGWGGCSTSPNREADQAVDEHVVVVLEPGIATRGRFVDQAGSGVESVDIELRFLDSEGRLHPRVVSVKSDADGRFDAANLDRTADLWVVGSRDGYRPAAGRFASDQPIELSLKDLQEDCTLSGRVVDPEGRPVGSASVFVFGANMDGAPGATTSSDGRFVIERVGRGDVEIVISAREFARTEHRQIETHGGRQDVGDLAIARGAAVTVRVTGAEGALLNGRAKLSTVAGQHASSFEFTDGLGVSDVVPAGSYHLQVKAPDHEAEAREIEIRERQPTRLVIEMSEGRNTRIRFVMPPGDPIRGPLVGSLKRGGEAIYRFRLSPTIADRSYQLTLGIGEGERRIEAEVGNYHVASTFWRRDLPTTGSVRELVLELVPR